MKTISGIVVGLATALFVTGAQAVELSNNNKAEGSWKINVGATANVIVGGDRALNDNLEGMDVNVDRPFVIIRVTSPDGKLQFEGAFNTQALINRDGSVSQTIPEHVVQELKVKYQINPMLSVAAGYGSVGFGAGREDMGERAAIPLVSEQSRYAMIKDRLMAEVGLTFETGTTVQLAVFDGRQAPALDQNGELQRSDMMDVGDSAGLRDSASLAISVQQQLGQIMGADVKIFGSYAKIRDMAPGVAEQDRIAMGAEISKKIGTWSVAALYQFVKVFGDADVESHLAEVRATKEKLTIFARFENTKEGAEKSRSVSAGVSYKAYSNSVFAVEPFLVATAKQTNDQDTDWGAFLGTRISVEKEFTPGKKTE